MGEDFSELVPMENIRGKYYLFTKPNGAFFGGRIKDKEYEGNNSRQADIEVFDANEESHVRKTSYNQQSYFTNYRLSDGKVFYKKTNTQDWEASIYETGEEYREAIRAVTSEAAKKSLLAFL